MLSRIEADHCKLWDAVSLLTEYGFVVITSSEVPDRFQILAERFSSAHLFNVDELWGLSLGIYWQRRYGRTIPQCQYAKATI